jgi:hypothetical protein
MAKKEKIKPLRELIAESLKFEIDKLVSRSEWGSINFEGARDDLTRIFSIVGHLNILPLESLTDQTVDQIHQSLTTAMDVLSRLDKFSLSEGTPTQIRDRLVNEIHSQADNFYTIATPWIPFLAYQKGDVARNISELTDSVSRATGLVETAKTDIRNKSAEIEDIVIKAREASASAGAAVFTKDFSDESKSLETKAESWLKATGFFGVLTIVFAIVLWLVSEPTDNGWEAAQKFGARLVVLVVLFTATLWCGRIYKALMHQSVTNKHRALSLQTFQAFSAAASDDQTRNAVLTETTRSIFSLSATGYISEDGNQEGAIRLIELQKIVGSSGQ